MIGSRSRGCGLDPHRNHCVVSLDKRLFSTGSALDDLSKPDGKMTEWDVNNQIKSNSLDADQDRLFA